MELIQHVQRKQATSIDVEYKKNLNLILITITKKKINLKEKKNMIEVMMILCSIFGCNIEEDVNSKIKNISTYEYPSKLKYSKNSYILAPTPWKKFEKDKI